MSEIGVFTLVIFDHQLDVDIRKDFNPNSISEIFPIFKIASVVGIASFLKGDTLLVDSVNVELLFLLVEMHIAKDIGGDEVKIAKIATGSGSLIADTCSQIKNPNFAKKLRLTGVSYGILARRSEGGVSNISFGSVGDVELLPELQRAFCNKGQRKTFLENIFGNLSRMQEATTKKEKKQRGFSDHKSRFF